MSDRWKADQKMHCPACGRDGSVWYEPGEGDYYVGVRYVCVACEQTWHIQGPDPCDGYELKAIEMEGFYVTLVPEADAKRPPSKRPAH
jgi:transposase-like protein